MGMILPQSQNPRGAPRCVPRTVCFGAGQW